jgi:hypothetical protein
VIEIWIIKHGQTFYLPQRLIALSKSQTFFSKNKKKVDAFFSTAAFCTANNNII